MSKKYHNSIVSVSKRSEGFNEVVDTMVTVILAFLTEDQLLILEKQVLSMVEENNAIQVLSN